jgi:hypothetical protein
MVSRSVRRGHEIRSKVTPATLSAVSWSVNPVSRASYLGL